MKYRFLGKTGVLVSELCFGAMTFGGEGFWKVTGAVPQVEANKIIKIALDEGINFFDTANAYSYGQSETILANSFRELGVNRHDIFVATKLYVRMSDAINNAGASRLHIHRQVDESLKRMKHDHIDLLYIHSFDPFLPIEDTMRGLDEVVRAGKVRYVGISNAPAWQVMKANAAAEKHGWNKFDVAQYYYSIVGRDVENEIIPMCVDQKMAVVPWSPLAGGFLSGKYRREQQVQGDGSRRDTFDFPPVNKELAYNVIDEMDKIAKTRGDGCSVAQIAIAWLLRQPGVTSPIFGSKKPEQISDTVKACNIELTEEEVKTLNEIGKQPMIYPYWMINNQVHSPETGRLGKYTINKTY